MLASDFRGSIYKYIPKYCWNIFRGLRNCIQLIIRILLQTRLRSDFSMILTDSQIVSSGWSFDINDTHFFLLRKEKNRHFLKVVIIVGLDYCLWFTIWVGQFYRKIRKECRVYSHLSNRRGGGNKRRGVQKLKNQ